MNGVRPFPTAVADQQILSGNALANITETASLGWSHYKGLWVAANQRAMKGLQFNAFGSTLAKSTDTNSLSTGVIVVQDSNNITDRKGHRTSTSAAVRRRAIYELPFRAAVWSNDGR